MAAVAVCADMPQVSDASAYTTCTSVVWMDSSELNVGLFDGFDPVTAASCAAAVLGLWALAWVFPLIAGVITRTR